MSLWEFAACVEGWRKANSPSERLEPPSPEEFAAMVEDYERMTKH
jgi:hypothetical protein